MALTSCVLPIIRLMINGLRSGRARANSKKVQNRILRGERSGKVGTLGLLQNALDDGVMPVEWCVQHSYVHQTTRDSNGQLHFFDPLLSSRVCPTTSGPS